MYCTEGVFFLLHTLFQMFEIKVTGTNKRNILYHAHIFGTKLIFLHKFELHIRQTEATGYRYEPKKKLVPQRLLIRSTVRNSIVIR